MTENLKIELTGDEALVLFEFLSREIVDKNGANLKECVNGDAEIWALNDLLCALEKCVPEVFDADFQMALRKAQERLADWHGGQWPW